MQRVVTELGKPVKFLPGRKYLRSSTFKVPDQREELQVAESAIVAGKRVTSVEQRVDGFNERKEGNNGRTQLWRNNMVNETSAHK
jgi:hypothetical protein